MAPFFVLTGLWSASGFGEAGCRSGRASVSGESAVLGRLTVSERAIVMSGGGHMTVLSVGVPHLSLAATGREPCVPPLYPVGSLRGGLSLYEHSSASDRHAGPCSTGQSCWSRGRAGQEFVSSVGDHARLRLCWARDSQPSRTLAALIILRWNMPNVIALAPSLPIYLHSNKERALFYFSIFLYLLLSMERR